jgi:hypothetical protein
LRALQGVDDSIELYEEHPKDFMPYHQALKAVNKLCVGLTASGLVGILPPLAQTGDVIGVIKGFSIPVVLRKTGEGYIYVGACKILRFMEGEAGKMLQEGRAKLEKITIH